MRTAALGRSAGCFESESVHRNPLQHGPTLVSGVTVAIETVQGGSPVIHDVRHSFEDDGTPKGMANRGALHCAAVQIPCGGVLVGRKSRRINKCVHHSPQRLGWGSHGWRQLSTHSVTAKLPQV